MNALKVAFTPNSHRSYVDPNFENEPKKGMLLSDFMYSLTCRPNKSKAYKTSYEATARYITAFSEQMNATIYTNSVTEEFLEDFIYWLQQKNLRPNTVKGIMERVKSMTRKAGNYGYAVNRTFDDVSVEGEDAPAIALSMSDITRLYYYQGLTKKQEGIRDLFIVGCMTGLRFSDYSTLEKANIDGSVITKKTKKTGALVHIPIHKYVREIIEKYDGFPPCKNLQYFNRYIKMICKKVGFDDKYTFHRVRGTENTIESYEKWELIGSHTARRSFASNMYNSGRFTTVQIMSITGHASEKSFLGYIKMDRQASARSIASDMFFNQ